MGMNMYTYIGPVVKVPKTKDFDPRDFCHDTINETLYVMNEDGEDYWVLGPNKHGLSTQDFTIGEQSGEIADIFNPDMQAAVDEFTANIKEYTDLLPVPFEIVWGIVSRWS